MHESDARLGFQNALSVHCTGFIELEMLVSNDNTRAISKCLFITEIIIIAINV